MGSGKSTVARDLRGRGYPVLDADQVVGLVLGPGGDATAEIKRAFGDQVMTDATTLNRRALAAEVFGDPAKLSRLEAILHPRVRDHVAREREALRAAGRAVAFYDVPLLFEKKMEAQFDAIVVVSAAREVRLHRAIARTGLTATEIEARWANQLSPEYKESRASVVIRNDGDEVSLNANVDEALRHLKLPAAADA